MAKEKQQPVEVPAKQGGFREHQCGTTEETPKVEAPKVEEGNE